MKKLVITGVAVLSIAAGAFGQGSVILDNNRVSANGVRGAAAGSWYSGAAGFQIWMLPGSTVPAGLNTQTPADYAALSALNFKSEATYVNQNISVGAFSLPQLNMSDVSPAGATVVLGIAVWSGASATWADAAAAGALGGVIAFPQATANYLAVPQPPAPDLGDGWNGLGKDLVLLPIPEPSSIALAGLGAAALLIFRRRK